MAIVIFELCANRVQMKINHISYQFIMFFSYAFATGLGEALAGYPIFPNAFDWACTDDCWDKLISTLLLMFSLQMGFYIVFYLIHVYRNKWLKGRFSRG